MASFTLKRAGRQEGENIAAATQVRTSFAG